MHETDTHCGSCLCGKVAYEFEGAPISMSHCHCVDCRKAHGAAFSTNLEIDSRQMRFVRGEEHLRSYRTDSGSHRAFCNTCGSTLICWGDGEPDRKYVCAATLDTEFHGKPEFHIFVSGRVPWYVIRDRLPRFERNSDDPV